MNKSLKERLSKCIKINKDNDCHIWTGAYNPNGFPRISYNGKSTGVKRVIWILNHGNIPTNHYILSRCGNKKCVNLEHLFISKTKFVRSDKSRLHRSRLNVDIPTVLMDEIRNNTKKRNITITKYIIKIITKALEIERSYN